MATPARDANGHFLKRAGAGPETIDGDDTLAAGSAENADNGEPVPLINPAEIIGNRGGDTGSDTGSDTGGGKRKAGWPKGKKRGAGKEGKTAENLAVTPGRIDLDSLNFTLFYAHSIIAKATKNPELELERDECKNLSDACMNVMQHYNIKASQKAIDWGNLLLTMTLTYGSKIHAINERKNAERAKRRAESAQAMAPFGLGAANG